MTQSDQTTPTPAASPRQPTGRSTKRRILELVISWASQSPRATMILRSHPPQGDRASLSRAPASAVTSRSMSRRVVR
jgi:hypothetical protein